MQEFASFYKLLYISGYSYRRLSKGKTTIVVVNPKVFLFVDTGERLIRFNIYKYIKKYCSLPVTNELCNELKQCLNKFVFSIKDDKIDNLELTIQSIFEVFFDK